MTTTARTFGVFLCAMAVVSSVVVIVLGLRSVAGGRRDAETLAGIQSRNLAQAIDLGVSALLDRVDRSLLTVVNELERSHAAGALDEGRLRTLLAEQERLLPEAVAIRVTDAEGRVVYNNPNGDHNASFTDRPFWPTLRDDPAAGRVLSGPILGKFTKRWVLTSARRYNLPGGRFGGVVVVPVFLEEFRKALSSYDAGEGGLLTLRDLDCRYITRYPEVVKGVKLEVGDDKVSAELRDLVRSGRLPATYHAAAPFDRTPRTLTVRRVHDAPLVVVAGIPEDTYLSGWRADRRATLAIMALFLLLVWGAAGAGWFLWSRRLKAEDAVREARRGYETLFQLNPGAIVVLDEDGNRCVAANGAFERQSGFRADDMAGRDPVEAGAWPPELERPALLARLRETDAPVTLEARLRRKDGGAYDALLSLARLQVEGEWRILVVMADITERKAMEAALRESEARHRATLESMTDLVFVLDAEGRFVAFHAPVSQELVMPPAAFLGKSYAEVLPPPVAEALAGRIKELRAAGTTCRLDYELDLPTGRTLWSALVTARRDEAGRYAGATLVSRNVTEQTRLEERLHQREKMDAIGQLAGGIAHDFNNQLAGIIGFTELLQSRMHEADQQEYLVNIMTASKRAAELTKQLLAFARKGKYRNAPVDVHQVLAEAATLLERGIDKRIRVALRLEAGRSLVLGDATQLQNAVLNLGLNARDAMPRGGDLIIATRVCEFHGTAKEADLPSGRYIQIGVTDTGVGMDPATKRRIFEPFFTTKEAGKGTGLGLASVYGTVKNHGGAIRVYSEPGNGSTFNLYLPLLGEAAAPAETDDAAEAMPTGTGCVLLVDDEPVVLGASRAMLESLGYSVRSAADPEEALAIYRSDWREIDLVILDMVMPKMGGRDLFLAMRQVNPAVKALLASGYSINGEAQSILDAGVIAFLQKPIDRTELARHLAEILSPGS